MSDLSDYERQLLSNVEQFGWNTTSVVDPEGRDPTFSYSAGFTSSVDSPEFIIFGLGSELAHTMLGEVFHQLKDGKAPADGSRWSDVLAGGVECVLRAVHPDNIVRDYLNSAIWYWKHTGHEALPPVVQLVWPGKLDGLFPWDDGCDELVRKLQPPLWLPPEESR